MILLSKFDKNQNAAGSHGNNDIQMRVNFKLSHLNAIPD
jgi:hypothetical protein